MKQLGIFAILWGVLSVAACVVHPTLERWQNEIVLKKFGTEELGPAVERMYWEKNWLFLLSSLVVGGCSIIFGGRMVKGSQSALKMWCWLLTIVSINDLYFAVFRTNDVSIIRVVLVGLVALLSWWVFFEKADRDVLS